MGGIICPLPPVGVILRPPPVRVLRLKTDNLASYHSSEPDHSFC